MTLPAASAVSLTRRRSGERACPLAHRLVDLICEPLASMEGGATLLALRFHGRQEVVTMQWAPAPQQREQMVLFAKRLEDAIAPDHTVRMLDSILSSPQIRWSEWEAAYHGRLGQPPIHPSVLAK